MFVPGRNVVVLRVCLRCMGCERWREERSARWDPRFPFDGVRTLAPRPFASASAYLCTPPGTAIVSSFPRLLPLLPTVL